MGGVLVTVSLVAAAEDYAELSTEVAMDCMKAAFDAGVNFFDCAEGYAEGKSEIVMGQAIKKFGWKRNDLVISTKINWGGAYGDNPVNNFGLSRKHVIEGTAAAFRPISRGTYRMSS